MKWRGWIVALHRDMGYFFTGALLLYAVSGLAVNHVDDWNPSFVIERRAVTLDLPSEASQVTERAVLANLEPLGEASNLRGFDFPSASRVKIYLKDGSIVAHLSDGQGEYETIRRRPLLYQVNTLHLNPAKWWKVFSDVFAASLILIAATGLFVARGRHGLAGRGKWFVGAGLVAPLAAMILFSG
ncbi:MAG: PepSY-associated TM helix domain-containing protein [Pirellulales bacterium]|nr:PepSY-associated TM helix domain-containing protein [Pirellulales bacterium]